MEMTIRLPQNYIEIEEEMMYLDGGARYSGRKGWSVVEVLGTAGYGMMAFGKYIKKAVGPMLGSLLSAFGVEAIYYAGSF